MTESRKLELQTEIAKLEELDTRITNRVNNEFEAEIEVECSLALDYSMQYESE